ncbi:hypothetical protein IMSHALPRED_008935 [Imshaugia aleurites]|uniref:Uncharacterized protein n=1 Tax=Imshaugia aleurites TaxID=172621 RepID=A0A8H3IYH0_9LECA|nr:hypothetical protein IMSHALPRED_008935 [Imshaugia aleurites]
MIFSGFNTMRVMNVLDTASPISRWLKFRAPASRILLSFFILHARKQKVGLGSQGHSSSNVSGQIQSQELKRRYTNPSHPYPSTTGMAPSKKASVQKGAAAHTPSAIPRNAAHSRQRSASPSTQPTLLRIRDEPPARSTRSWVGAPPVYDIMPTATQRIPIDCPMRGCQASTVHQHLPQLQYFNPRPGRAVHYHGYENSNSRRSSRPSLIVSLRIGNRAQETAELAPAVAENEPVSQEENDAEHGPANSNKEVDAQELLLEEEQDQTLGYNAAYSEEIDNIQRAAPLGRLADDFSASFEQQHGMIVQGDAAELDPSADDFLIPRFPPGVSDSDADPALTQDGDDHLQRFPTQERGPVHDEGNSYRFQAPMTPPPSSPMAAEESHFSQGSIESSEQSEHVPAAVQMQFGDWLPGQGPQATLNDALHHHGLTYEELTRNFLDPPLAPAPDMAEITGILQNPELLEDPSHRPVLDEGEDPDLPSLMMRPRVADYMRHFEREIEEEISRERYWL